MSATLVADKQTYSINGPSVAMTRSRTPPAIDQNNASRTKYQVAFKRLPNVVYNVTSCSIPSLEGGSASVPTPFSNLEFAGTSVRHNDFSMEFLLNENHTNYAEIMNWMYGANFPEEFDQYKALAASEDGVYSDFTVTVLSNAGNPVVRYTFTDGFPKSLSSIDLSYQDNSDEAIPISASFGFTLLKHEALKVGI